MESKQRQDYESKISNQLEEWSEKLNKLAHKAEAAETDARQSLDKEIDRLRLKQQQAEKKLEELKRSSSSAWEDAKAGLDKAWSELRTAVESAAQRFDGDRGRPSA